MPAGRPSKPLALKLLQGTVKKSRLKPRAPRPAVQKMPAPPPHLNDREKAAWRYLAKLIDPLQIASAADVVAFEKMVLCYALMSEAHAELRARPGLTLEQISEGGGVIEKPRPQLDIINKFMKELDRGLGRFGMNPADREKVTRVGDDAAGDPLDEFAVGGHGAA